MESINKFRAKSEVDVSLLKHSKQTAELSEKLLYDLLIKDSDDNDKINYDYCYKEIVLASYLHDIGKCSKAFQDELNGIGDGKLKYSHNEIGWAFLIKYFTLPDDGQPTNYNNKVKDRIINTVFWHHGVRPSRDFNVRNFNAQLVLNELDDEDVDRMKSFVIQLLGGEYIVNDGLFDEETLSGPWGMAPDFYKYINPEKAYDKMVNERLVLIRSFVFASDRFLSKEYDNKRTDDLNLDNVKEKCKHSLYRNNKKDYDFKDLIPEHFNSERFERQLQIAEECFKYNTYIMNLITGFGKTLITILAALKQKKKIIWVTPRKDIADSVYKTIIEELEQFGLDKEFTIEKYYTGERKASHPDTNDLDELESDIVVMNIDNFLKPTVDSSKLDGLFLLNNSFVVFDEFHEFKTGDPYFSAFLILMNIRNNLLRTDTTLLSATPSLIHKMWEMFIGDEAFKTGFAINDPSEHEIVHDRKRYFKILDLNNKDDVEELHRFEDIFYVYNSIKNLQEDSLYHGFDILLHYRFQKDDLNNKYDKIYQYYGKEGKLTNEFDEDNPRPKIGGTNLLGASHNFSCDNMALKPCSPEDDGQKMGRQDRFEQECRYRNEDEFPFLIILTDSNKKREQNENIVRGIRYSGKLGRKWEDFFLEKANEKIKNNDGFTLKEYFIWYDEFNKEKEGEVIDHIKEKYKKSLENLSRVYPVKYPKSKDSSIKAGSNPLRVTNGTSEIFTIAKRKSFGGDKPSGYSDPFNMELYEDDISEEFKEGSNTPRDINKEIINIIEKGDERFDYLEQLISGDGDDKKKLERLKRRKPKNIHKELKNRLCYRNTTPYIIFNYYYNPFYGLIKKDLMKKLERFYINQKNE